MIAASIHAMSGCAWIFEVGPSHVDAEAISAPYCREPLVSLPEAIDRDVSAIRFTGRWEEPVPSTPTNRLGRLVNVAVPYLFGSPAYAFVERDAEFPRPDGAKFVGYAVAGGSRLVNRVQTCPDGTADLGAHPAPKISSPHADPPRACATMQTLLEPTARWQVRRSVVHSDLGHFSRRVITDEIVDTLDGKVRGHVRRVDVETTRETTGTEMIGIFPVGRGKYHVRTSCGRTIEAADVLRSLPPAAPLSPR